MDLQDTYDQLDNIVRSLDVLVSEITDKYYIDILNDIKFEAQDDMEKIEPDLLKEQLMAETEMNYQYEEMKL